MTTQAHGSFLVDGQRADTVSLMDRGLQYGDGLFETMAVSAGTPHCWARHLNRLVLGCNRLDLAPPEAATLEAEAVNLSAGGTGVLKIIVSRGESGRGYTPPLHAVPTRIMGWFPGPHRPHPENGVEACICATPMGLNPALAGIKHLNRLEQVMARAEVARQGTQEGIMLDVEGRMVSGTMSNLFLVRGKSLVTPELQRCGVAGIVRDLVIEHAGDWGLVPEVRDVPASELESADELFFTNSLIGVWPVRRAGSRRLPGMEMGLHVLESLTGLGYIPAR